jgi:hypothetical protein
MRKTELLNVYENTHLKAQALLEEIRELILQMPNGELQRLDWGHVGDITHIAGQLTEVRDFLAGDNDE